MQRQLFAESRLAAKRLENMRKLDKHKEFWLIWLAIDGRGIFAPSIEDEEARLARKRDREAVEAEDAERLEEALKRSTFALV